MLQVIFIFISGFGLLYFVLAKRQFDFFSIGFVSACVYFLPGYVGYALYPPSGSKRIRIPAILLDETYVVMIVVLVAILIGAFLFDRIIRKPAISLSFKDSKYVVHFAVGLAFLGFVMTVFQSGFLLLSVNKPEMMQSLTHWHIIWVMSASVGAVISFSQKKFGFMFICIILLCFDLFIGFRSSFAMALISFAVIWFSMAGKQRLIIKQKAIALFVLAGAFFVILYKRFYLAIKAGAWDRITDLAADPGTYLKSILESEPFTTQVILNEVIRTDFHITGEHFSGLLNNVILFSPSLGAKTVSFNDLFQSALFPFHDAGMANNIWAEMWSAGGWGWLGVFIVLYVCILFVGSYLLRTSDPVFKGGVALFFSYWAFYIYRNDIGYQVTLEKRVFIVWFICWVLSVLLMGVSRASRNNVDKNGNNYG